MKKPRTGFILSTLNHLLPNELLLLQSIPLVIYIISGTLYTIGVISDLFFSFCVITIAILTGWFGILFIISVIRFINKNGINRTTIIKISIYSLIAIVFVTAILLFVYFFSSLLVWYLTSL